MFRERGENEEGKKRKKREKDGKIQSLLVEGHDPCNFALAHSNQLFTSTFIHVVVGVVVG